MKKPRGNRGFHRSSGVGPPHGRQGTTGHPILSFTEGLIAKGNSQRKSRDCEKALALVPVSVFEVSSRGPPLAASAAGAG